MNRILLSLSALFQTFTGMAQTEGTLTVTATTSSAGGNFAPKNIVAIWVEDEQGNFVKTLLAYAQTRKTHLNTWEASTTAAGSAFNVVDAITGATKSSHGTRTCSWNAKDFNQNIVADGNYTVWMELTDKNATGNFSSFNFTKGAEPVNLTPLNVPSFGSISISWEPLFTGLEEQSGESMRVYPNPSGGIIHVSGKDIREVQVISTSGGQVYTGTQKDIDLSAQPAGVYYVRLFTNTGTETQKIFLNRR